MTSVSITLPSSSGAGAALALLRAKGRTFALAANVFSRSTREDVATLYAFCREVDDAVDEAPTHDVARARVAELRSELDGLREPRPHVASVRALADRGAIDLRYAHELLDGVESDIGAVRIANDAELRHYAYLVAGTVGAMMQRLLGAPPSSAHALEAAMELGIAMQLTNICRDVREDAALDRVYLPADRLRAAGVSTTPTDGDRARLASVVGDVLALAEDSYAKGLSGAHALPLRARIAVVAAAHMYRAIGRRLLRLHNGDALVGRVVVPWYEKLAVGLGAVVGVVSACFYRPRSSAPTAPLCCRPGR